MSISLYNSQSLYEQGILSDLDWHFAELMQRLSHQTDPRLHLAAALVSLWTRQGHICLDLSHIAAQTLPLENCPEQGICPPLTAWLDCLSSTSVVGESGEYCPLILDNNRLYLYRYWRYEQVLAQRLWTGFQHYLPPAAPDSLKQTLEDLFPDKTAEQKRAVLTALLYQYSVISGGPGTGKTTTVVKVLALLLSQHSQEQQILLLAPTGKAAMRLQEAIGRAKAKLSCADKLKQAIPETASTLHRALGVQPNSPYFRFNPDNLLSVDVVVVDEVSMVDLALMSKLIQALPPHARLILLGDQDQLASVEAGAVLGDIFQSQRTAAYSLNYQQALLTYAPDCAEINVNPVSSPIQNALSVLHTSHRFKAGSHLGQLAQAVNQGQTQQVLKILQQPQTPAFIWFNNADIQQLKAQVLAGFRHGLQATNPADALKRMQEFRVLCAHRHGSHGIYALNKYIEKWLQEAGLIQLSRPWYQGRPILITQNHYGSRLFNGELGVIWTDEATGQRQAWFENTSDNGALRRILPTRLPPHETAFAMTIHKSQGSEFDTIALVLPETHSPVLNRALLYTGLTRARDGFSLLGNQAVIEACINKQINRHSGLGDKLWQAEPVTVSAAQAKTGITPFL